MTEDKKIETGDILVHVLYGRIEAPQFYCVTSISPSGKTFKVRHLQVKRTRSTDGGYGQAGYCVPSENFYEGGTAINGKISSKTGRYQVQVCGEYKTAHIWDGKTEYSFDYRD